MHKPPPANPLIPTTPFQPPPFPNSILPPVAFPNKQVYPGQNDSPAGNVPPPGAPVFPQMQPPSFPTPVQTTPGTPITGTQKAPPPKVEARATLDPKRLPNPTKGYSPTEVNSKPSEIIVYSTDGAEAYPPRPDTDYLVKEVLNCSPRYMRSSMYTVPTQPSIYKDSKIPFGIVVQPFAEALAGEAGIPLIDLKSSLPVRCNRCGAYINPYVEFLDNGNKYTCPFCGLNNEVPEHYYSPLFGNRRQDFNDRVELWRGSIDYQVTAAEYNLTPPQPPAYIFVVETTQRSISCNLLDSFVLAMQRILPTLFLSSDCKIGFITFDTTVSFYNIHPGLNSPQIYVVPDVTNIFAPLPPQSLLFKYSEAQNNIDTLISRFAEIFKSQVTNNSCLGAALKVAARTLSKTGGGKIITFLSTLPDTGNGQLKKRDHMAPSDSENEKLLFKPQNTFYLNLGEVCAKHGISVDLFIGANTYVDVNSLGAISKTTGGQIYYYPNFCAAHHQEQLYRELYRNLSRESVHNCLLRLRCGRGIVVSKEYGAFTKANSTDLNVPFMTADSCITFELNYDDSLAAEKGALFQVVILHTTTGGERRIRVHTLKVPIAAELHKIFKGADLDTVLNILGRQISEEISEHAAPEIRKRTIKKVVDILATYRKKCSSAQKDGQLILPDALKLLPIYSLGLMKTPLCAPLKPGTLHFSLADTRAYFSFLLNTMPLRDQSCLLYPIFFEIHSMSNHQFFGKLDENSPFVQFPGQIRLTRTALEKSGIYLMDCLQRLYLWIGSEADQDLVQQIVPPEIAALDMNTLVALPRIETDLSDRLFNLLSSPRLQRCLSPEIYLIRQGSQLEQRLLKYMLEDGFTGASVTDAKDMNYVDYLCLLHKKIINQI